ncbi:hypothetical protein [Lysobacter enzymogenes]|uniref:hypothetical protein n=1 Tax=Lysobacter enzymogenes TaxID=69 RepID=UPI001A97160B|nr:hypothetical protein [Lysobacter enzymogenes]QQP97528.1 hypothetical protein JHW38_05775 [Lysobacter enzymogenes]
MTARIDADPIRAGSAERTRERGKPRKNPRRRSGREVARALRAAARERRNADHAETKT